MHLNGLMDVSFLCGLFFSFAFLITDLTSEIINDFLSAKDKCMPEIHLFKFGIGAVCVWNFHRTIWKICKLQ